MAENISSIGLTPVAEVAKAGGAGGAGGKTEAQGQSFTKLVEQFTTDAMETSRTGEQTSLLAAAKKAELVDVVTAVSDAEVTLQTVTALRDRVIQAYQEIIKMPI